MRSLVLSPDPVKIDAHLTDPQKSDAYWAGKINLLVAPSYRLEACRDELGEEARNMVEVLPWLSFGAEIVKHIPSELG